MSTADKMSLKRPRDERDPEEGKMKAEDYAAHMTIASEDDSDSESDGSNTPVKPAPVHVAPIVVAPAPIVAPKDADDAARAARRMRDRQRRAKQRAADAAAAASKPAAAAARKPKHAAVAIFRVSLMNMLARRDIKAWSADKRAKFHAWIMRQSGQPSVTDVELDASVQAFATAMTMSTDAADAADVSAELSAEFTCVLARLSFQAAVDALAL